MNTNFNFVIENTNYKARNYTITVANISVNNGNETIIKKYFNCSRLARELYVDTYLKEKGVVPSSKEQSKALNRLIQTKDFWNFFKVAEHACINYVEQENIDELINNKSSRNLDIISTSIIDSRTNIPIFYTNNLYKSYSQQEVKGTYIPLELIDLVLVILDPKYLLTVSGILDTINNLAVKNNLNFDTQAKVVIKVFNSKMSSKPKLDIYEHEILIEQNTAISCNIIRNFYPIIINTILKQYENRYNIFNENFEEFIDFVDSNKNEIDNFINSVGEEVPENSIFSVEFSNPLIYNDQFNEFKTFEEFCYDNYKTLKEDIDYYLELIEDKLIELFSNEDEKNEFVDVLKTYIEEYEDNEKLYIGFDKYIKRIKEFDEDSDIEEIVKILKRLIIKDYKFGSHNKSRIIVYIQNYFSDNDEDEVVLEYPSYSDFILKLFPDIFVRFLMLGIIHQINNQQVYIDQFNEEKKELNEVTEQFNKLKSSYADYYPHKEWQHLRMYDYIEDYVIRASKKMNLSFEQQRTLKHKLICIIEKRNHQIANLLELNYKPANNNNYKLIIERIMKQLKIEGN